MDAGRVASHGRIGRVALATVEHGVGRIERAGRGVGLAGGGGGRRRCRADGQFRIGLRQLPELVVVEEVVARHAAEERQPQDAARDDAARQSDGQRHAHRRELVAALFRRRPAQSGQQFRHVALDLQEFRRVEQRRPRRELPVQTASSYRNVHQKSVSMTRRSPLRYPNPLAASAT